MYNVEKTCRTCMREHVPLVSLFLPWNCNEDTSLQLAELLTECTSTQVALQDGLPQYICGDCVSKLQTCYTFRNQTLKCDTELRRLFLLQSKVKKEPSELKSELDLSDDIISDFDTSIVDYENDNDVIKSESDLITESKPKKIEKLVCSECNKKFKKQSSLEKHFQKQHKLKQEIVCMICGNVFKEESELVQHMLQHSVDVNVKTELDNKIYKCTHCNLFFDKLRSLASHAKKHKSKDYGKFQCDICSIKFSLKSLLRRHMKLHTNVRPFECEQCGKKYSRKDQLSYHMNKHGAKSNVCPYCPKAFSQLCNLRDHIRTHTGERPFLCSQCGQGFNNSSNLRQHLARHEGLRPFACNLCPKTFVTKGQMSSHMDTHTGARPYACAQCGVRFTKAHSLKKHAAIHAGVRRFDCDVCEKKFMTKDHLKRHSLIHSGERPFICRYCERGFRQSNDLVKHLRTHVGQNVYECTVCLMRFRTQAELKKHYPIHYINGTDLPTLTKLANELGANSQLLQSGNNKENATEGSITITFDQVENKDTPVASITVNMNSTS